MAIYLQPDSVRLTAATSLIIAIVLALGCERPHYSGPVDVDPAKATALREKLTAGERTENGKGDATASQGTGWATLVGRFTLEPGATPRSPQPLPITKDVAVCKGGQAQVLDNVMEVGPEGGIKNVLIYLRTRNPRIHPDLAEPPQEPTLFDQEKCVFLSRVFAARVGQPIEIKNSDPVTHNTNIAGGLRQPGTNPNLPPMQSITFTPSGVETTPMSVTCSIHPWMKAHMITRDNPYFDVTKENGEFRIENLPAGEELEFQVWHENAAGPSGALLASHPEAKWTPQGRFKITLPAAEDPSAEPYTFDVTVPGRSFK